MGNERKKNLEATIGINYKEMQDNINIGSDLLSLDLDTFTKLDRSHLQGSSLQKHGSAAEAIIENNYNRERILKGSGDRMEMSESAIDPITDLYIKNANGKIVSKAQVKYYKDAKSTMEAISEKNEYNNNDVKYVPKDQLEDKKQSKGVITLAEEAASKARSKAAKCKANGDIEGYNSNIEKAKRYEHTAKTAKADNLIYKQSLDVSKNDFSRYKVMGKKVLLDSNSQGVKSAEKAARITGIISSAQNVKAVIDGDKEIFEAVIDTSKEVATSSAIAYLTTAGGSIAKSGLDATSRQITNKIGETAITKSASQVMKTVGNNIGIIITCSIEVVKSFDRYLDGEIDDLELVLELGEKGTGITASVIGSQLGGVLGEVSGGVLGNFVVPGAGGIIGAKAGFFVGEVVGGMVGYFVGNQLYSAAVQLLTYDNIAAEKRLRLIGFCDYCQDRLNYEKSNLEMAIDIFFENKNVEINEIFNMLDRATLNNNYEGINNELINIGKLFDENFTMQSFEEFNDFIGDESSVLKL